MMRKYFRFAPRYVTKQILIFRVHEVLAYPMRRSPGLSIRSAF